MSDGIVTHGDGKPRFDKGVVGKEGQYAARLADEAARMIPLRDAARARRVDVSSVTAAEIAKVLADMDRMATRQGLKDLTEEVKRVFPDAVWFSLEHDSFESMDPSDFVVIEVRDANRDVLYSDEDLNMGQHLGDDLERIESLFPAKAASFVRSSNGGVLVVNCETVAETSILTGRKNDVNDSPFAVSRRLEGAVAEVRKAEVQTAFDRIEDLKGSFPDDVSELRFYHRSGSGSHPDMVIVDHDGNPVHGNKHPAVAELFTLGITMTTNDLFGAETRLEYNVDSSPGHWFVKLH